MAVGVSGQGKYLAHMIKPSNKQTNPMNFKERIDFLQKISNKGGDMAYLPILESEYVDGFLYFIYDYVEDSRVLLDLINANHSFKDADLCLFLFSGLRVYAPFVKSGEAHTDY